MIKTYNFLLEGKLITVQATNVNQGRKLAELTLLEMKQLLPK
ncbi:hypothetical protein [Bacillus sp. SJS]|nr:hypothetical protein [Bacillus sp. SJS]